MSMYDAAAILYLTVETPLHAGSGSSLGIVDLPIQRERATQYPMIQGSGVKGALRAQAHARNLPHRELIFGPDPDTNRAQEFAGALSVGDARILLFPVRALTDVFVYTISAEVIARFRRDLRRTSKDADAGLPAFAAVEKNRALLTEQGQAIHGDELVLEEYSFATDTSHAAALQQIARYLGERLFPEPEQTYWQRKLARSLVALPDADFRDFTLYSTEVAARVHLDAATKTVIGGALWTEEHLPVETVLYAPLYASPARRKQNSQPDTELSAHQVLENVKQLIEQNSPYLQLGGDETVGRGIVRATWRWLTPQPGTKEGASEPHEA